jgi:hypothetical protein
MLVELPGGEGRGRDDGGLFGEGGEREEREGGELAAGLVWLRWRRLDIDAEAPEGEGGGEDVGVGQGALREPDGVERGEQSGDAGGAGAEQIADEAEDREQRRGANQADQSARGEDVEAEDPPPGAE